MIPTLIYAVHSGNLFGTERMALETLEGFRGEYHPVLLCPDGALAEEARGRELEVMLYGGFWSLAGAMARLLWRCRRVVFMSTSLKHAACLAGLNCLFRRQAAHLHLVHGGAEERDSYGRKKYLNRLRLLLVAVSPFVADKLKAYGVAPQKVRIAGNFLTEGTRSAIRRGGPLASGSRLRGLVISRLIPAKRVDLLLTTLETYPDLAAFSFDIFGLGGQHDYLRQWAARAGLNVRLPGFSGDLNQRLGDYDFLVHLCPEEPFGLAILEAMAADLPVLVPDSGGVTYVVRHGETGFLFEAGNPVSLAQGLRDLRDLPEPELRALLARATEDLQTRFSSVRQIARYRELIAEAGGKAAAAGNSSQ